jgi:hypothetical protein
MSRCALRLHSLLPTRPCVRPFSQAAAAVSPGTAAKQNTPERRTKTKAVVESMTIHKAVQKIKELAWANFDETIEIAINTHLDPRKPNQSVKGVATLPYGTGRAVRVCVFATGGQAQEARDAGADLVGGEDLVSAIQGGEINFDTVIATPEMMGVVGKLGKVTHNKVPVCTQSNTRRWYPADFGTERLDAQSEDRYRNKGHREGG